VAKILVADDNSNIQKMVGLALKDQGIDVVAVGNGEAAVRKISDVHPDLVLADVFMPVRNGYEVCKYVKDDSALSHIPVILLVGAFDPLDEQEAQRVGADGVLKKPFVPPDPLISMVKSALSRAGVSYSGATPSKDEAAVTPPPLPKPSVPLGGIAPEEPFHEPVSKRPAPLTIESTSQPLAFGSLLETPEIQEPEEPEEAYAAPSNSPLMPERNWGVEEEEGDEVVEEDSKSSWRRGGPEEFEDAAPAGKTDWREAAFNAPHSARHQPEQWAPTKEKSDFVEAVEPEDIPVVSGIPESPRKPATFSDAGWASRPYAPTEAEQPVKQQSELAPAEIPSLPADSFNASPEVLDAPVKQDSGIDTDVSEAPKLEELTPAANSAQNSWFSVASSPWEAEAHKASQLAATWDTGIGARGEPAFIESQTAGEQPPEETSAYQGTPLVEEPEQVEEPATVERSSEPAITAPTEEFRAEATQVVEQTIQETTPYAHAASPSEGLNESSVDDVVAKVLAKLSPEALQAVTREILKPVIEAIVRDELKKK
jgi:CheY-like chemotaxis protein